jgi:hypothetical protein
MTLVKCARVTVLRGTVDGLLLAAKRLMVDPRFTTLSGHPRFAEAAVGFLRE